MSDRFRRLTAAAAAAVAVVLGLPLTAAAAPDPVTRAAPAPAGPVSVTLETLDPHDVKPTSNVQVTAVIRNTGADSTGPISVRLRRGLVLDTRGELQAADHVRRRP